MLTRRQLLAAGAGVALGVAGSSAMRRFALARGGRSRWRGSIAPPRYHVKLFMPGGVDSIYTMDPKLQQEVASGVDVPYPAKDVVTAGQMRLGPHFAPLAKWAPRFSILLGVDVSTANHNTGESQAIRLRTKTTERMPSIFEILGAHRDSQPLATITLGASKTECHTAGWFGEPGPLYGRPENTLLKHVDRATPDDLRVLGKVLRRQAQRLTVRNRPSEARAAGQNLGEAAAFFERVADLPRFAPTPWQGIEPANKEDLDTPDMMERLQRALWLLEHDLTSSVFVCLVGGSLNWDTHTDNARRQTRMQARFVPMLDRFLTELERRSNRHGRLVDNTAVIVASELGRYPYLNAAQGKDHFPEAPFLFAGPWFPGGNVFGRTGKNLEAQPIDLKHGGVARAGGHHVMVDDVGTTLLALSGIDPELYGYNGHLLQFLLRG